MKNIVWQLVVTALVAVVQIARIVEGKRVTK